MINPGSRISDVRLPGARKWEVRPASGQVKLLEGHPVKVSRTTRRLRTAIIFAGAGTATGSGLIGLALWWITHH
ncbi:MAG: hypothetical protein ACRDNF_13810 [Streptosporangiaceae bacterium]